MKTKMYFFQCLLILFVLFTFSAAKAQTTILTVASGTTYSVNTGSTLLIAQNQKVIVNDNGRLVINAGGKLAFAKGAFIELNGNNAVLEINGMLEIAASAVFTFSGSGFVRMGNNGATDVTMGSFAKMSFWGSGKTDKVLEVSAGKSVVSFYDAGSVTRKLYIGNGKVELGTNALLDLHGEAHITNATIQGGQGIKTYGQNNLQIDGCTFNGNNTGIDANGTMGDHAGLTVTNCSFVNNLYAIKVNGASLTVDNCYITYANMGILATNMTGGSAVTNTNLDYVEADGINYTGLSTSAALMIKAINFDDAIRGVVVANTDLYMACSNLTNMFDKGISVANGALYMTPGYTLYGYNTISVYGAGSTSAAIYLDQPTGLSIDYGSNEFYINAPTCPYFIYSTTALPGSPSSLNARGNNWHTSLTGGFLTAVSAGNFRIPKVFTTLLPVVTSPVLGVPPVQQYPPCSGGPSTQGVSLSVKPHPATAKTNISIVPNPASSEAVIKFTLLQDEHMRLEVTDILGKTSYTVESKAYTAGDNQISLDATLLPTGTYIVKLIGSRTSLSDKLLIVR